MTDRKKIDAYVRLSNNENSDAREISFRLPPDIPQKDILEAGFAIDGNSALISVASYIEAGSNEFIPVSKALLKTELAVMKWFDVKGYEVLFK